MGKMALSAIRRKIAPASVLQCLRSYFFPGLCIGGNEDDESRMVREER